MKTIVSTLQGKALFDFSENVTINESRRHSATLEREKAMQKCLDAQSEAFKTSYREFALSFAETNETFLVEEIRFAYLKTKLPRPHSKNSKDAWKSTGGIIRGLIRDGLLKYYCVDGIRKYAWTLKGERQMPVLMKGSK